MKKSESDTKKIPAAGGLVFNRGQELLMIFRFGKWDLPKGHQEKDETPEDCALREVKEETGLRTLSIKGFAGVTVYRYFDEYLDADALKEVRWFIMEAPEGEDLVPLRKEGIEGVRWIKSVELELFLQDSWETVREIVHQVVPWGTGAHREPGT
jgi:8-oxo-dGTP pyrophosphatase MutT (NUDIX family)